jgi:glutathione peroxidase
VIKNLILLSFFAFSASVLSGGNDLYNIKTSNVKNKPFDFGKFKGKAFLVVNTASRCGYTPQFSGLQKVHEKYQSKGFEVIGFPTNDFKQEDMEGEKIAEFCSLNYGVKFTMLKKGHVNGPKRHPLYKYLISKSSTPGEDVSWNFEKFLVDKYGNIVARFKSGVGPESPKLIKSIEKVLN